MLSHPRRGDQQSVEEQSSLVPVREPETRSVPAGLPDCRLSDGEPRGCGVPDDDPEDDPERAAPDGRLQQQPRQFQSTSVIKRLERSIVESSLHHRFTQENLYFKFAFSSKLFQFNSFLKNYGFIYLHRKRNTLSSDH